jgi:hypothetical protein
MAATEEAHIYRDLMRFKPEQLTPNAWAVRAGVSRAVWADMRRHGNPSRRTLEKLLTAIGSSLAEFEALRLGHEPATWDSAGRLDDPRAQQWTPAQLGSLPLIRTTLAGEWDEPGSGIDLMQIWPSDWVERLSRPASLAGDAQAYAITIVGEAMWPRFKPGRRIAIAPRSSVAIGDDVLICLKPLAGIREIAGAEPALMANLVGRTNEQLKLMQFNPKATFQIESLAVESIQKIAGELF